MHMYNLQDESLSNMIIEDNAPITINGERLSVRNTFAVAHQGRPVKITREASVLDRVQASHQVVVDAIRDGQVIYGVNTGFGGMADVIMSDEDIEQLQANMLWTHKEGSTCPSGMCAQRCCCELTPT
jgi:phenylalanine ammonia-lyase